MSTRPNGEFAIIKVTPIGRHIVFCMTYHDVLPENFVTRLGMGRNIGQTMMAEMKDFNSHTAKRIVEMS